MTKSFHRMFVTFNIREISYKKKTPIYYIITCNKQCKTIRA